MSCFYTLSQNNKKGGNQMWYARPKYIDRTTLDSIARRVQAACSMTLSDVKAVIIELIGAMNDQLKAGNKVRLDGFGDFSICIHTSPAVSEKDFNATDNIKSCHISFQPQRKRLPNGRYSRAFCEDVVWKPWPYEAAGTVTPPAPEP